MATPAIAKTSTGTTLERFRQELTCTCGQLYNDPKTLPCLHSFCAKCVEGHIKEQLSDHSGESREMFHCHVCKQQYKLPGADVNKLPTNRSYKNLVSHLTLEDKVTSEQGSKCEECEEGNAVILCKDCSLPLCEGCQLHHSKSKKTRDHVLLPVNELRATSSSSDSSEGVGHQTWMCDKHNGPVCIYCMTCDVVICRDCALVDHDKHTKQFAHRVIDEPENRPKIKEHLGNTEKVRSDFKQAIKELKEMKESLRKSKEDSTKDVGAQYDKLKAELDRQREDLLQKVNGIFTKKTSILDQQLQELQDIEKMLEEGLKFTNDILTVGIAEEILFLKTQMIQRLEVLCNEYGPYPRTPRDNDIINFAKNEITDAIGTVSADSHVPAFTANIENMHFTKGQSAEFKVTCRDIIENPLPENTQVISVELRPETEGAGEMVPGEVKKGEDGVYVVSVKPQNHGPHKMSISSLVNELPVHIKGSPFSVTVAPRTGRVPQASVVISGDDIPDGKMKRPWGIAVNKEGVFVVSDIENHCLIVFDQNGKYLRAFGKEGEGNVEFKSPRGLAFSRKGRVLVAEKDNHRVQVVTIDGVFRFKFGGYGRDQGQFHHPTGVAVGKDGTIFVTDSSNQRIQFFNSKGVFIGVIDQWGTEPNQLNQPCSITTDSNGRIVVTEQEGCRVQVFEKYEERKEKTYKYLLHFGSKGSSKCELDQPIGVAVDTKTDDIYVTELENKRVSIFDSKGAFISFFGVSDNGLSAVEPMSAALLPDLRLIVTDCGNNRLLVFPVFTREGLLAEKSVLV